MLCNRPSHNSVNRALRCCRPPRSLPDAQEDMGQLLCGFAQRRANAASLHLAGMPPRALANEPLDDHAQPSAIPEVRMWSSAELACTLQHERRCKVQVLQLEGL